MALKIIPLALALLVSTVTLPATAQASYSTVSSEAFARSSDGVTLIDVREPSEWAQTGAPAGAKKISISRPDFVEAVLQAAGGDKSKPVAFICRSGTRSVRAAEQLAAAGFTRITNIGDGMVGREGVGKGWLAANLPITRAETAQ
jgi:rhodanese-related sulfurtransferase